MIHLDFRPRSSWAVALVLLLSSTSFAGTVVRFDTVLGTFDIELSDSQMPVTVNNFLGYVNTRRYDGSVIHRNSDTSDPDPRDFVIQGGGFFLNDPEPTQSVISFSNVQTDAPINDEPGGGVTGPSNVRGTISMAKSGPNTVTSQWFINQGDNSFLDSPTRGDGGFAAFGQVLGDGMTIVDAIGDLPLPTDFSFSISSPFNDLPLRNFSGDSISDIREIHTVVMNRIFVYTDFDHDGMVGDTDLGILENNFGQSGADFEMGDANGDGNVDGSDFLLWQQSVAAAPALSTFGVPEPSTLVMAACGLLAFAIRR